ncbi:MAG: hypothetical protein PQJ50_03725, partial [Spirochaetales bacterium]|nr:hypothetical protein [Spirochaetales bacterium]
MTGVTANLNTFNNPPPLSSSLLEAVRPRSEQVPLKLPMTLVLNTTGLAILKNTSGEKGISGYELPVSTYKPDVIGKLIMKNCLKRIDISLDDVISNRRDIIDLSKLLYFTVLYKQFNRDIVEKTLNTKLIKQWNREHPRQKMEVVAGQSPSWVEKALSKRQEELALFRRNLLIILWKE